MALRPMRFVNLRGWPITRMLRLEEALVRHEPGSWCLVNALPASSAPTVVVGLSGKPHKLLNADALSAAEGDVPVVRRFTGGGTVVVGGGTVVASLVVEKDAAPCVPFPREIMAWTEDVYAAAFGGLLQKNGDALALRDFDYTVGDRKVGGNAQCIAKDKFIHHTSFLWDFDPATMAYLRLPEKRPEYRADREHDAFLARISDAVAAPADRDPAAGAASLGAALKAALAPHFDLVDTPLEDALDVEARRDAADWRGGWKPVDFPEKASPAA